MSNEPIQEVNVVYDPGELAEKVQRRRGLMRSRLISLGITVAVLLALYLWQRDQLQGAGFLAVYGLVLGISVAWFAVFLVGYLRARRDLAGIGAGTAVRIGPPGVQVAGLFAAWPEVAALAIVKAGLGRSPALQLTVIGGPTAQVPLDQISIFPATLDSTVRAFSGGRHGVDLAALDN